jgi:hypothetical protein
MEKLEVIKTCCLLIAILELLREWDFARKRLFGVFAAISMAIYFKEILFP